MGAAAASSSSASTGADRAAGGPPGPVSSEKPWPLFAPSYLALTPHSAITFIFICVCLCFLFCALRLMNFNKCRQEL